MIHGSGELDGWANPRALASRRENELESETSCTQPETRVDFFYFFARNPLKSPDSDE
jgi:hypothetical protein